MEDREKIQDDEFVEEVVNESEAEAAELAPAAEETVVSVPTNPKRAKIEKLLAKKDIKFRGPFSYRTIRIFGYIFMLFAQIYLIFSVIGQISPLPETTVKVFDVLQVLSIFALPLFLAANFCIIMSSKRKIKNFLILYSVIAILIYLAILLIYYRYLLGMATAIVGDVETGYELADIIAKQVFGKWINYNIFVDLSLFSLFFFFFFYTPKNIKSRKGLLVFRWCSLLPVLFAIASTVLYGLHVVGTIDLPVAMLAIMPCRSFSVYAIFFILSLVIKLRSYVFRKWGGTEEEYESYLKTRRNSLEVATLAAIVVACVCLVDFILLMIAPYSMIFGLGINFYIIGIIPFIFLLSYTRQPKFKVVDTLLPFIFLGCVLIVFLEAILYLFVS